MADGKAGAPQGNQNAAKAKIWHAAILRALRKRSKTDAIEALDDLAETLLTAVEAAEGWAVKELGDRLDGKPHQSVDLANPDGTGLFQQIERIIKEKA